MGWNHQLAIFLPTTYVPLYLSLFDWERLGLIRRIGIFFADRWLEMCLISRIFIGLYIVYMYMWIDHGMYEDIYVCLRRYTIQTETYLYVV